MLDGDIGVRKSSLCAAVEDHKRSFYEKQMENLRRVNPFEHIRKMQLNKIRINDALNWDVAKYEHFVAKDGEDYKAREATERRESRYNKEQIINEEVRISDFAYAVF